MSDENPYEEDDSSSNYKTSPSLIGRVSTSLNNSLGNDWSNLKTNFNSTVGDFSKGNILGGLSGVYMMDKNPTGSWGSKSSQASSGFSYSPDPSHLEKADENGVQKLNPDGQQAFNAAMSAAMSPNLASTETGIPILNNPAPGGQPGQGIIGRAANQVGQGLVSTLLTSLI